MKGFSCMKKWTRWIALTLFVCLLTSCGVYDKTGGKNYKTVDAVENVVFDVPKSFANEATAISLITDSQTYSGTNVFQNGADKYVLFNMKSIVIACAATNFGFAKKIEEKTLENDSIAGVWMEKKNFHPKHETKKGVYKCMSDVSASYSVTPNQYADLTGYMASITNGATEYTIFAGAVSDKLTGQQKSICQHVVKSLSYTAEGRVSQSVKKEKSVGTVKIEEPKVDVKINDSSTGTDTNPSANEGMTEPSASTEVPTNPVSEQPITEPSTSTEPDVGAKDSTVYTPLSEGEWGTTTALTKQFGAMDGGVRLDKIYTGDEAMNLVKQYKGRKKKPSEGTSFVVCEYSTTMDPESTYLDCRFLGMNGEKLVLRGVSYPMRTYDLKNVTAEGNLFTHQYVYYEVPTGCPEYILSFGYQTKTGSMTNAFYKVNGNS